VRHRLTAKRDRWIAPLAVPPVHRVRFSDVQNRPVNFYLRATTLLAPVSSTSDAR
jgi:hypothetical protein